MRWLKPDDVDLMLAVWNDPAFVRHVGDRGIRTRADALDAMKGGALNLYKDYGYGPFRVALRKNNTAIGISGLFRRDGLDIPDLGYSTLPEHCGKGYAYEAAVAVLQHARDDLGIGELIAIISAENDASIGLIRKLGFEFERMHRLADNENAVRIYHKQLN